MPEQPFPAARFIRSASARAALAVVALGIALLLLILFVDKGQSAGSYNLNNKLAKIRFDYREPCQPGTLQTAFLAGAPVDLANPKVIDTSGDVVGCLAIDGAPGRLLIADNPELFFYTTVTAKTVNSLATSTTGAVAMDVFPAGSSDWTTKFVCPGTCQAYIGIELVSYTMPGTTFTILARNLNTVTAPYTVHDANALVRRNHQLKLVARNQREYVGYLPVPPAPTPPAEPTSGAFDHGSGAEVRSPIIHFSCRARLEQPPVPGNDTVLSRSKCYAIVEPGTAWTDVNFPNALQTPAATPFPDNALQPLIENFYHDLSAGPINETSKMATQTMTLTTDYIGITCFPYIQDALWSKVTSTINLSSDFALKSTRTGEFRISIYVDQDCTTPEPLITPIGALDSLPAEDGQGATSMGTNLRLTWLNAGPATWAPGQNNVAKDTDGDGCADYRELGGDKVAGGLRDPFNKWDYFNPLITSGGPGAYVNRIPDISAVVTVFGQDELLAATPNPTYQKKFDRSGNLGGIGWSFKPPNGTIRIPDISAAVSSFGHDCPVITPAPNP